VSAPLHIAIDAMSGDCGPSVCVPAALEAARAFPDVRFTLIGREDDLQGQLKLRAAAGAAAIPANMSYLFATQIVEMTDHPREALRRKKDSSMRRALDLVKCGDANACVSAGNTGALMAMAHFVLKMLPGVERPAIVSMIPSRGGHTYMLDLGANASCTPAQLCQFAVMGSVLAADLEGAHEKPRVGLLNIGEEDIKGNEIVQAAHNMLAASDINYVGFVEGHDIFSDKVDVVVTDGFTGNVALKSLEGALRSLASVVFGVLDATPEAREASTVLLPMLLAAAEIYDPDVTGGAVLLGVDGVCIISHGSSSARAITNAVRVAADCVATEVVAHMKKAVTHAG